MWFHRKTMKYHVLNIKKNKHYTSTQKETVVISRLHDERGFGEFETDGTFAKLWEQRRARYNLPKDHL